MPFFNDKRTVFARETLTVSNSVKTLTAATYTDSANIESTLANRIGDKRRHARGAVVVVESQSIRATKDGTTPVAATTGTKLNANDVYILETYDDIKSFKAIRDTGVDGTIQVDYYR